jgi:hypothetical protein
MPIQNQFGAIQNRFGALQNQFGAIQTHDEPLAEPIWSVHKRRNAHIICLFRTNLELFRRMINRWQNQFGALQNQFGAFTKVGTHIYNVLITNEL